MAPSRVLDTPPPQSPSKPSPTPISAFLDLITSISSILGPTHGLTSKYISIDELFTNMKSYVSADTEWECYAFQDFGRGYTRNLVSEGNESYNLLVLVWTPGKGSAIHDHADAHCLMKVLKGSLVETRFSSPCSTGYENGRKGSKLEVIKETRLERDEVTYMSDELGLHKISNPGNEVAVSLHLYTPPNDAREGCNIFDERTGKSSHVTQSNFYSVFGVKV